MSIRRRRDQISDYRSGILIKMTAESSGQSRITEQGKLPINDVRWPKTLTCVNNELHLLLVQQSNSTLQSNQICSTTNGSENNRRSDAQVSIHLLRCWWIIIKSLIIIEVIKVYLPTILQLIFQYTRLHSYGNVIASI